MISEEKKVLGIVGIRSKSKGVPNKNIRDLSGKPLIAWILDAAKRCKHLDRIIVSTDSEIYAEIAKEFGAEVPCLRPKELACDNSSDFEYVEHMLDWLDKNESYHPDIIVRLMATVPLQEPDDIDAIIQILNDDPEADSAVVISEARQHPMKALKIIDDGFGGKKLVTYLSESGREVNPIARQNYEPAYFRSNVIACRTNVVKATKTLTGDMVRFHIIPQERAIDIDKMIDFFIVEQLMGRNKRGD